MPAAKASHSQLFGVLFRYNDARSHSIWSQVPGKFAETTDKNREYGRWAKLRGPSSTQKIEAQSVVCKTIGTW